MNTIYNLEGIVKRQRIADAIQCAAKYDTSIVIHLYDDEIPIIIKAEERGSHHIFMDEKYLTIFSDIENTEIEIENIAQISVCF